MTVKRRRTLPEVRNPALELSLVKPIAKGNNRQRESTVKSTEGEPLLQFEGSSNPYLEHQRNDLLLSIQHMRSEGHDEMVFLCITHCKELTFKAIHYELVNMQVRVKADDVAGALQLAPRVLALLGFLGKTWDVLSTITPHEFNQFRNTLGIASGQQSYMYRHVEFVLGNKSEALAVPPGCGGCAASSTTASFLNSGPCVPGCESSLGPPCPKRQMSRPSPSRSRSPAKSTDIRAMGPSARPSARRHRAPSAPISRTGRRGTALHSSHIACDGRGVDDPGIGDRFGKAMAEHTFPAGNAPAVT